MRLNIFIKVSSKGQATCESHREFIDADGRHRSRVPPQLPHVDQLAEVPQYAGAVTGPGYDEVVRG